MVIGFLTKKNEYRDSAFLMKITERIRVLEKIDEAAVLMATDNNKKILQDIGLFRDELENATPNDLIIVVSGLDEDSVQRAIFAAEGFLTQKLGSGVDGFCRTLDSALDQMRDANFALISVPGEYASREARKALDKGLNVLLFSDNVPIEDELKLKLMAKEKGLLMMGPGCGTAIINNVGLCFANVVRKGSIGIVAAAGTGLQEVSVLVDRLNSGISQAIGTGGRDLSETVGGIMTFEGLKRLQNDEWTKVIVLVSKQPSRETSRRVLGFVKTIGKPVVVNLIGDDSSWVTEFGAFPAQTLEEAAVRAVSLERGERFDDMMLAVDQINVDKVISEETSKLLIEQRYVRGLFSGGSFCSEALFLLTELLGNIYSNVPLYWELKLDDSRYSKDHTCVDLGEEEFTLNKVHPMIDYDSRCRRLLQEAADSEVAVILMDLVLGYGSNMNPASSIIPAIKQARDIAEKQSRYLPVVVSLCGTDRDPQNLAEQEKKLKEANVLIMPSNAQATRLAASIAARKRSLGRAS